MTTRVQRSLALIIPLGLMLFAAAAGATPSVITDPDGGSLGSTSSAPLTGACTLEPGPLVSNLSEVFPGDPWTAVATRLHLTSCTLCPAPQALLLNDVSFRVKWFAAGSATAQISVVGATQTGGCFAPDPNIVFCGPINYAIASAGPGAVSYTLAMPAGCCISGDAFLLVRFIGLSSTSGDPSLYVANVACTGCEQYFTTQTGFPTLTDFCSFANSVPIWMSVGADCCQPTPTQPGTWGTVKARYR